MRLIVNIVQQRSRLPDGETHDEIPYIRPCGCSIHFPSWIGVAEPGRYTAEWDATCCNSQMLDPGGKAISRQRSIQPRCGAHLRVQDVHGLGWFCALTGAGLRLDDCSSCFGTGRRNTAYCAGATFTGGSRGGAGGAKAIRGSCSRSPLQTVPHAQPNAPQNALKSATGSFFGQAIA